MKTVKTTITLMRMNLCHDLPAGPSDRPADRIIAVRSAQIRTRNAVWCGSRGVSAEP